MRKLPAWLAVISSLLISGCWDRIEVNDLAIVTAAAIDYKDKDRIELAVEVFIPRSLSSGGGQGGGGGGGGGQTTLLRSQVGVNISDAMSKLQSKFPRKIFWGQCKVFIFGEKAAKQGIRDHLDFLLRHPQPRERAYVYVSEGEAKQTLLTRPPLERFTAETLREMSDLHIGMDTTIQSVDRMLASKSKSAALPYVKVLPPQEGEQKLQGIPYIAGTAVFREDKMVGKMSEMTTRGLLWIRNKLETYTITIEPEETGGHISLSPVTTHVTMIPQISNGKWKMHVKVKTDGVVVQNGTKLSFATPEAIEKVEKAYQEDIKERMEQTFQQAQHEFKADVVGIGREFHRRYPKQWERIEHSWNEKFPEVEVSIEVEARIRRRGYIIKPGSLSKEEVIEE